MRFSLLALLSLCAVSPALAGKKKAVEPNIEDVSAQLMGRALTSDGAWDKLIELCDDIGHRLAGTEALEKAVDWGEAKLAADGLIASREPVILPVWIRGEESAVLLDPVERPLKVLALGGSVGTPEGGITAEVVVVANWEELEALGDAVQGKIVLYDVPFTGYGETVQYRGQGALRAAKQGAVAVLVRSVTPHSLDTPHTGAQWGAEEGVPAIPAAAVTLEAAALMHRLSNRGKTFRVHLELGAPVEDDRPGHNVVGEITGRELPDEVVVLGCHLDSWDVGQGAQDDGAGCVAAMEAGRLIAALPFAPRRTVRVVLFTNEENGLAGGKAYGVAHGDEKIVAAMEMDTGAGSPWGWRVDVRREDEAEAKRLQAQAIEALAP
ncbi:MAG: M20/M25/M40 family metallo-hydrolase, partial [Rhodobacterales bacterium]|nr:M20/M25/M40 family metallo-hydrolase [Rhodobacterales bacterium]